MRDWQPWPERASLASYDGLAEAGIRFSMLAQAASPGEVAAAAAHPGAVIAVEGPNEVNLWPVTHAGLTGDAAAVAYQAELLGAVHAQPGLSGISVYNLTSWPDLAPPADFGNVHAYDWNGDQPLGQLAKDVAGQRAVILGLPFVTTESGYATLPLDPGGRRGVDEATQAALTLTLLSDGLRRPTLCGPCGSWRRLPSMVVDRPHLRPPSMAAGRISPATSRRAAAAYPEMAATAPDPASRMRHQVPSSASQPGQNVSLQERLRRVSQLGAATHRPQLARLAAGPSRYSVSSQSLPAPSSAGSMSVAHDHLAGRAGRARAMAPRDTARR